MTVFPLHPSSLRGIFMLVALPLLLSLAGCTVTLVGPGGGSVGGAASVIERFDVRGSNEIRVGQRIAFQIRTSRDGFVTLSSLDPNGEVNVFARNLRVVAGRTVVLDGSSQGGVFLVTPPRGEHRVRASFSTEPTDPGRVTFVGRVGESAWFTAIRIDLEPFPTTDVAEARFSVR